MKFKLLFSLLLLSLVSFGQQIPDEIKPPSWSIDNINNPKAHKLPTFNVEVLKSEDVINDKDKSKPWRFGHELYVDHDFNTHGEWTTLDNGDRIWRMAYKSEGAYTLNFMFDQFYVPEGATLYVYNNEKNDLLRPFTHYNNNPEEVLGTWLVEGDHAWIEYYQPANVAGQARLTVGSVVHGYRTAETYQKGLNDSGACNQDVDCDITPASDPFQLNTRKEEVKKAAGMLVSGANGFCSGTLVNNTNNDGTPYFLTANHCGAGEAGWAFRFNWRSPNPSCSTNTPSTNGSFDQTVSGSILRAASSQSDMKLVEITDTSFFNGNPDVVWSGWNRSTTDVPTVNFSIHHPSGDIQKVCREDDGAYRQVVNFNGNPNTQMWYIDEWELGVTEPGSSGSGLFDENGRLIGMLSGGAAACSGTVNNGQFDYYGRFGVAWDFGSSSSTRLRDWLDPSNSGVDDLDLYPPLTVFNIDARTSSGSNDTEICSGDFAPSVTLINNGALDLTSATVSYFIDSDTPTVVNWTGSLTNGSSTIIATPTYSNLSSGNHSFTVTVSNPNGTTDQNTSNDANVFNFVVSPSYSTAQLVLNIITDDYAGETTWELRDENGTAVAGGGNNYVNNTTYQENINIPSYDICYTFTIFDSFGDGICCGYGNGSYNLQDENNNVIISGGNFGSSEAVTFKALNPLSIDEFDLDSLVKIYPNPVNTNLNISSTLNDNLNYKIHNMLGQEVLNGTLNANGLSSINMVNLKSGVYFIELTTNNVSLTKRIIKK